MNPRIRLLLAVVLMAVFGCNAPKAATPVVPSTLVPATVTASPTHTPTVVPTPMTLDNAAQGAMAWQPRLNATAILSVPTPDGVLAYAGTWGQGVFVSADHGASWSQIDSGPGQVTSLAVFPDDPRTVLVGTANQGVILLSGGDGALDHPALGLAEQSVRALAIGPAPDHDWYAGTTAGIYRSRDRGATWNLLGLADNRVVAITFIDGDGSGLLAATAADGVMVSRDGGSSWSPLALSGIPVNVLLAPPGPAGGLLAGTSGLGVVRIGDSSENARFLSDGEPVIPAAGGNEPPASGQTVTGGPYGGTATAIVIDPSHPGTLYAASEFGVFKSSDNGDTWRQTGLASINVYALAIDPVDRDTIYAGTRGQGFFISRDAGHTWTQSSDSLISSLVTYTLAVDPQAPGTVYAGGRRLGVSGLESGDWGGGVLKSNDGGATWVEANNGLPEGWVYSLAVDPRTSGVIYAGTHSMGVYKSVDGGATWMDHSQGLVSRYHTSPNNLKIRSLAINPRNPDELIAGTWAGGSVFESRDAGASWTHIGMDAEPTHVRVAAYNPVLPGLMYVGMREGGLLTRQSQHGEARWQPFPDQEMGGWLNFSVVQGIAIDPRHGRTIFLALQGAGILRSPDGGESWKLIDDGFSAAPVTGLAAVPDDPSHLFASTDGAGVFQSTDGGATWSPHTWATPWDKALGVAVDSAGGRLYVPAGSNGLAILTIERP